MHGVISSVAVVASVALTGAAWSQNIDTNYTNWKIDTVDVAQHWADAKVISGGKFFAVGRSADIEKLAGKDTKRINLNGKFVLPGLVEDHIHPNMDAENKMNVEILPGMTYVEFWSLTAP